MRASRVRRRRWPHGVSLLVALLVIGGGWWWEETLLQRPVGQPPAGQLKSDEYVVRRVVDGDTLVLEPAQLRVRLQGLERPETGQEHAPFEPWGLEATAYAREFLKTANWQVRVEIDGEPIDRSGRPLAFVWHEGRLLNEELVRRGLARAKTKYDFSAPMKKRLRKAQREAQAAKRGIWSGE